MQIDLTDEAAANLAAFLNTPNPGNVTLYIGDAHEGHGLYTWITDDPGEGSLFLQPVEGRLATRVESVSLSHSSDGTSTRRIVFTSGARDPLSNIRDGRRFFAIPAWTGPMECVAALAGLTGAALLALKGEHAGWGWAAFLVSNAGWIAFAIARRHWFLLLQQVGFTATSLLGIWSWLL
jgi:hypothetical protein